MTPNHLSSGNLREESKTIVLNIDLKICYLHCRSCFVGEPQYVQREKGGWSFGLGIQEIKALLSKYEPPLSLKKNEGGWVPLGGYP